MNRNDNCNQIKYLNYAFELYYPISKKERDFQHRCIVYRKMRSTHAKIVLEVHHRQYV